jgi:hypothetical protein
MLRELERANGGPAVPSGLRAGMAPRDPLNPWDWMVTPAARVPPEIPAGSAWPDPEDLNRP